MRRKVVDRGREGKFSEDERLRELEERVKELLGRRVRCWWAMWRREEGSERYNGVDSQTQQSVSW